MNDDNHKTLQEFAMGEIIKELRAERDALKAELDEDSSLKTWFPITCDYLDSLRIELDKLTAQAEAYEIACEELERFQSNRAKAGKDPGTQGSLCDGMGWVYSRLDELETEDEAARKQEPCGWQSKFVREDKWASCSKEHYELVKSSPNSWPGYEVRAVYASTVPAQQSAEVNQEYPMQPMFLDKGLPRFEKNPIIDWLCEKHGLNNICIWWQVNNIERKYIEQLYQLIGYSIRGYEELSQVSDASFDRANSMAEQLLKGGENER